MADNTSTKKLSRFRVIGFDTMGTLLDEKAGVIATSDTILSRLPASTTPTQLFDAFEDILGQHIKENKPPTSYATILETAIITAAQKFSKDENVVTQTEASAFASALAEWPPFSDTVASLQFLAARGCKLILLSNMDTSTLRRIVDKQTGSFKDVPISALLGGDLSGAFKPDHRVNQNLLDTAQREYSIGKDEVLLVAQGLESDHVPAEEMGISSAWIDRYGHGKEELPPGASPDWVFTSLTELCDELKKEIGSES